MYRDTRDTFLASERTGFSFCRYFVDLYGEQLLAWFSADGPNCCTLPGVAFLWTGVLFFGATVAVIQNRPHTHTHPDPGYNGDWESQIGASSHCAARTRRTCGGQSGPGHFHSCKENIKYNVVLNPV